MFTVSGTDPLNSMISEQPFGINPFFGTFSALFDPVLPGLQQDFFNTTKVSFFGDVKNLNLLLDKALHLLFY